MNRSLTVFLDEEDIDAAKQFFRTKSSHAAIRTAIHLARATIPFAVDNAIVVRDQVNGGDLRITIAR